VNNKLNLATKPFTNRTLPWLLTGLMLLVSLIATAVIVRSTRLANAEAASIQNDVRKFRQEEEGLRLEADKVKESLSPEQLSTLKAAHELVDRKHFSWSRLLMDLEEALPGNVRVTRITVRDVAVRGSQTVAELDLAVVSKSSETITNMIASMDRVGIFRADIVAQNLLKGRGETGTEYELNVIYSPRAGTPAIESQPASLAHAASEPSVSGGETK
jgi:Tfp pilus assembly protein PilN